MRKRFEQQFSLGQLPISETFIDLKSRDSYIHVMRGLKEMFITPEYNEMVFCILEDKIINGKKATGRPGMDLWQIFVMAQVRLALDLSYDRLHTMVNNDKLLRQIMGVETDYGFEKQQFDYQRILDNVTLLDEQTLRQINGIIVEMGHNVFKKKEAEPLRLKTDSFVVESNVHFPTDYNLLWDCMRKCLVIIAYFMHTHSNIKGWRKLKNWHKELKNMMRGVGKISASGGANKEQRLKKVVMDYLIKSRLLFAKLTQAKASLPIADERDLVEIINLEQFMVLMSKHIDLLERRIIKGETIQHNEKIFSIFETYTEMIKKGKQHPNVELGKNLAVTTDQFHLIVDFQIIEHKSDSQTVIPIAGRVLAKHNVESWSFDRGYYSNDNKSLLSLYITNVIMPKKGKLNQAEKQEENQRKFLKAKNQHSAVESNINELEHRGLNRCPDRGYHHFRRYIAIGVCAYNIRRIGSHLLEQDRELLKREQAVLKRA
ncbi:MAG: ISNCY family transposase [Candidatus Moranbacteria bacterium]|nr:ISNCY family transposase [Candidatus Moranbacteria bacterium]